MWVPWAGLPPRLTLSALTVPGRFCTLRSGAARRKDVPAGHRRALSDFQPKLVPCVGFGKSRVYKHNSEPKRYITNPRVAENLVRILRRKRKSGQLFLECNPGESFMDCIFLDIHFCRSSKTGFEQFIWSVLIMTPQDISVAVCTLKSILIKAVLLFPRLPKTTFIFSVHLL